MRAIDNSRHMAVNLMTVLVEFPLAFKSEPVVECQ